MKKPACQKCPTSKYGILSGQSNIKSSCLQCPIGQYGGESGQTNNTDNFAPNKCESDQYLDATVNECKECPEGGFCPGGTDINGVIAKTGYWRIPINSSILFAKCLNPCACLGARNSEVHGCFNKQIGKITFPEGCNVNEGYREGSRLCADCMDGYSRDGKGKCKPCNAEKGLNMFLFILLVCGIIFLPLFLVWTTVIKRGGAIRTVMVRKIFLSFLQLTSLSNNYEYSMASELLDTFSCTKYSVFRWRSIFRCDVVYYLKMARRYPLRMWNT